MESVLVMMSTYNGEKYLAEQLDSILNQINVEVHLLIRDDGSKDNTLAILNDYNEKYDNITLYVGENVGYAKSFSELIGIADVKKYNFFSLADQDDVWELDKLAIGVENIKNIEGKPALYFCNLSVVDENLVFEKLYWDFDIYLNCYSVAKVNCATGCTMVFNKEAVGLYQEHKRDVVQLHDYWMFLICYFLGEVRYDSIPHIMYRQHSANAIGAVKDDEVKISLVSKAIRALVKGEFWVKSLRRIKKFLWLLFDEDQVVKGFYNAYADYLSKENKRVLRMMPYISIRTLIGRLRCIITPFDGYYKKGYRRSQEIK